MTARTVNPLTKFLLEVGPLAVFFLSFRYARDLLALPEVARLVEPVIGPEAMAGQSGPILLATASFMLAIAISLAASWWLTRHLPRMAVITAGLVAVFGGLTLWLQDETFIKMKPTMVYLAFAAILGFGLLQGRSYLKYLMESAMPIDDAGWMIFTRRWALFFLCMAMLNEAIWRSQTTDLWVSFKTFATLPLTFLFLACQWPLLKRHMVEEG